MNQAALLPLEPRAAAVRKVRAGLGAASFGPMARCVFARVGAEIDPERGTATACLDWTEDQPHLSGAAGAILIRALLRRGWIQRRRESRALRLTLEGAAGLRATLDVELSVSAAASAAGAEL